MEVFPDTPSPVYPLNITPVWNTQIGTFDNGGEQRRQKWLFAKYDVLVNYKFLDSTNAKILWAFYMARKGAFETFYIFDLYSYDHVELFVGNGDGSTTIFDLPGKSTFSRTLYVGATETTTGFAYLTGGGSGSADRVEFTAAPALGQVITLDFTGYLRIKCRFAQDKQTRENFMTTLMRYGIELKGL